METVGKPLSSRTARGLEYRSITPQFRGGFRAKLGIWPDSWQRRSLVLRLRGARAGIRWRILHGRSNYPDLLPSRLSGATRPFGECRVLWFGSRRGAGGLPAMPSLPPRDGTRKPGVERNCNDGGPRYASYRRRIPRRSLGCRTCRSPRCWATALIAAVPPSHGCASERTIAVVGFAVSGGYAADHVGGNGRGGSWICN